MTDVHVTILLSKVLNQLISKGLHVHTSIIGNYVNYGSVMVFIHLTLFAVAIMPVCIGLSDFSSLHKHSVG